MTVPLKNPYHFSVLDFRNGRFVIVQTVSKVSLIMTECHIRHLIFCSNRSQRRRAAMIDRIIQQRFLLGMQLFIRGHLLRNRFYRIFCKQHGLQEVSSLCNIPCRLQKNPRVGLYRFLSCFLRFMIRIGHEECKNKKDKARQKRNAQNQAISSLLIPLL